MSAPSSSRLERALELFVQHQRDGGDWLDLLARHEDLADLLVTFLDDPVEPATTTATLGDYILVREVGRGGVGTVHEARQRSLDRRVALKVLQPAFTSNPTALVRFRREAQILARLDHPGIVRVYATGVDHDRHWLAMEFVDGQSLATRLDALRGTGGHSGDSLRRLVETIAALAEALHHAHEAGVVHRDVKPSNVLLRLDGTAVLGDFGLARDAAAPALTQTGVVAGTPHYMAPEQVLGRGGDCDARTDVWGLGATLYECLTLQRAFDAATSQQVLAAVLARDPVDPRRHQRGLPRDLAAIVQKALEKEPEARYPTAAAFAGDLRAFLELRPVTARPPSRTRRLLRLARRQPLVGALLGLLSVSAVLGTTLLWQLPALREAAAARRAAEFEDAVVAGTMARAGGSAVACYAHYRRALELAPEHPDAVVGLCLATLKFDGPAPALGLLERHRAAEGPAPDLDRCRALLLRRLQRTEEAKALEQQLGPPTTPTSLWLTATARKSEFPTVVGLDYFETEELAVLQESARMLSAAVRIAPQPRLLLHAELALTQSLLDDATARRESASALAYLWPDHPLALYVAALCVLKLEPPRALELLQQAMRLGLDEPLGPVNLAVAQALTGQRELAAVTLEGAMWLPRQTDLGRAHIVETLHKLGDADREQDLCERWLQEAPDSTPARRAAAIVASQHGDHARALDLFRQCAAAAPEAYTPQWELAMALLNADDPDAARAVLQQLTERHPARAGNDPRLHLLRLDVFQELSDATATLAELQRWTTVRPADAEAWRDLAAALLDQPGDGSVASALTAAERADYLAAGEDARCLELCARALDRLGRSDEAAHRRARAVALPKGQKAR